MSLLLDGITIQSNDGMILCQNLNLTIPAGEIISIMGPSGCGKSTLLNAIAGHLTSDFSCQGQFILDGKNIAPLPAHQRQVGLLFQDDMLFPHLNIWENIAIALPDSFKKAHRKQEALSCLKEVELEQLANAMPQQISGGQRARVSLLRMLQAKPKAVLLDEPFNQLDAQSRTSFRCWVFEQLKKSQIPTLIVTHDPSDAPSSNSIVHWTHLSKDPKHAG
ncbi:ATP-binding cassette domain-containing protein [Vibrio hibernica]|uniref:ATP-binding cassette domain-containing protein n=1 Tax=Vibrio hibernica TaxID=2587465 RepID=UPI0039AE979F